jgi:spore coat polysaccharide biosynthesis protein SpsF
MKIIAITQARIGSTRLPAKVLKEVCGKTLLQIHIERATRSKVITGFVVATTEEPGVDQIVRIAKAAGVKVYQGSTNDVLDRFYKAVVGDNPDWVVRITSDCPLIDAQLLDEVVNGTINAGADYGTNTFENFFPDGVDVEVFSFAALTEAWKNGKLPSEREHVTPYIRNNSDLKGGKLFKAYSYNKGASRGDVRMTVDEPRDFKLITALVENLGTSATWREYADYIVANNLSSINSDIIRNEGALKSLKNDQQ